MQLRLTPISINCMSSLGALLPRLTSTCCGVDDGTACGQNGNAPAKCSVACANVWAPYASQCSTGRDMGDAALSEFFETKCNSAVVALDVLNQTVSFQWFETREIEFEAVSGTRYGVDLRVISASTRHSSVCTYNAWDLRSGYNTCDNYINASACNSSVVRNSRSWYVLCHNYESAGYSSLSDFCAAEFCHDCRIFAHMCDLSCDLPCPEDGVTDTKLWLLPPGARNTSQAVASNTLITADKGLSFTADATGTFTARVNACEGSGPVTLTVTAIGTALERSPQLQADSLPHSLAVACFMTDCTFGYDGAAILDNDGSGFDLVLRDAEAGRAYAFLVELPQDQSTAAQVEATFYQAGAVAGAAGFEPVVSGPMGTWSATGDCMTNSYDSMYGEGQCDSLISSGQYSCAAHFCHNCGQGADDCNLSCDFSCGGDVSYFQQKGCSNDDRSCTDIPAAFGVHPFETISCPYFLLRDCPAWEAQRLPGTGMRFCFTDKGCYSMGGSYVNATFARRGSDGSWVVGPETFPRFLRGTWVAPASGAVMLRLVVNCDVPAFAHAYDGGCTTGDIAGTNDGCTPSSDATNPANCASELQLTVTPGAYFEEAGDHEAGRRRTQMSGDRLHSTIDTHAPTIGTVQHTYRIVLGRTDVESQAATVWHATLPDQRTLSAPPTLDDMLVNGSTANALLGDMLTVTQEPHVVYPLTYGLDGDVRDLCGRRRRRMQMEGDDLHVTVDTHAPSPQAAGKAEQRLIKRLPGANHSRDCPLPHGIGTCDLTARTQAVDDECCNEPGEDCSTGRPATCNVGCAREVLPYFEDCSAALGDDASLFDNVVVQCRTALEGDSSPPREEPHGIGTCDLSARTQVVNGECCDERTEDCSSGRPATCNVDCALVVLPFFEDCSGALGTGASDFDDIVALCHVALDRQGRRRLQMGGDRLTFPIDTHAVCGLGSTDAGCTVVGQTRRQTRLIISRDDIEAITGGAFNATPIDERTRTSPPTLDEMLVSGTPANALLISVFVHEQEPLLIFPVNVSRESDGCSEDAGSRRLQMGGDRLHITIDTHAATPAEADTAVQRLLSKTGGVICAQPPPPPPPPRAPAPPTSDPRAIRLDEWQSSRAAVPSDWTQTEDRYCNDVGDMSSYSTAAEAIAACQADSACKYISDGGCNNDGSWETCRDSGSVSTSGSCMYLDPTADEGNSPSPPSVVATTSGTVTATITFWDSSPSVEVRISGGSSRGVLQMNIEGRGWGAVCDDGFRTDDEAVAFCATLGFGGFGAQYDTTHGDGNFAADDINCPSGSTSVSNCSISRSPYSDDCGDSETVGLDCTAAVEEVPTPCSAVPLGWAQFTGRRCSSAGRIETFSTVAKAVEACEPVSACLYISEDAYDAYWETCSNSGESSPHGCMHQKPIQPHVPGACASNAYDRTEHSEDSFQTCDEVISSGHLTCAADFCTDCGDNAHACDLSCGFSCLPVPAIVWVVLVLILCCPFVCLAMLCACCKKRRSRKRLAAQQQEPAGPQETTANPAHVPVHTAVTTQLAMVACPLCRNSFQVPQEQGYPAVQCPTCNAQVVQF